MNTYTEEDYKKFTDDIMGVHSSRNHKVKNSYGVYDAYKYIRKNKWFDIGRRLTEHEFYTIIRKVNDYLALNLSQGKAIDLPLSMGSLELRKDPKRLSIVNGKLHTNLPIDWNATLKLWCEDPSSYTNRTLIRIESDEIFRVFYNRQNALYTNKTFYEFQTNRSVRKSLKRQIQAGHVDAFLLRKYDKK
jgi:hypothetical protein